MIHDRCASPGALIADPADDREPETSAAGLLVTAIALKLGYATATVSIGVLRRTFGGTPAVYRERL